MSPTSPTYTALYDRLRRAHRRIRELEARQAELITRSGMSKNVVGADGIEPPTAGV